MTLITSSRCDRVRLSQALLEVLMRAATAAGNCMAEHVWRMDVAWHGMSEYAAFGLLLCYRTS